MAQSIFSDLSRRMENNAKIKTGNDHKMSPKIVHFPIVLHFFENKSVTLWQHAVYKDNLAA